MLLTPLALYGAAGAATLAVAAIGVQTVRLSSVRGELQVEKLEHAQETARLTTAALQQSAKVRRTESAWTASQQENSRVAETARQVAQEHAAAAAVAADGLRGRYATLAAACHRAPQNPTLVVTGPPPSAPGDLLVDVLGRLDSAAGEFASYADAARISGEQCAADYAALTRP